MCMCIIIVSVYMSLAQCVSLDLCLLVRLSVSCYQLAKIMTMYQAGGPEMFLTLCGLMELCNFVWLHALCLL